MDNVEILLRESLPLPVRTSYPPPVPGIGYSAVLALLWNDAGAWNLLITLRGDQLADHGGQVAFPGGRAEAGDSSPLQTALREAFEEVGIPPDQVDPLGMLEPADTSTGFRIWPVVGIIRQPVALKTALPEVSEAFWIPLAWLMEEGRWKQERTPSGAGKSERQTVFFEPYHGNILWGASAMITVHLLQILREGRPA
jgi:8-oxo-dGTP pyrophosphatase MutT (NUDIX family)